MFVSYALVFFVLDIVFAVLAFGGILESKVDIGVSRVLFFLFLGTFVATVAAGVLSDGRRKS